MHTGQTKDLGFNSGQIGSNSALFFLLDLLKQDKQVGFLHFEQFSGPFGQDNNPLGLRW